MTVLNFLQNATAITALVSIGFESGESAIRNSKKSAQTALAIKDIKDMTGDSMLKKSSEKHNSMKQITRNSSFMPALHKAGGAVSGFFTGAGRILKDNIPALAFSAVTLAAKNKTVKTIGAVGVGVSTLCDFIKNGTNLFEKTDIIEK